MTRLIWHGHACFELKGQNVTVVLDPFRGIGIPEPKAAAEIVLCSHSHQDHNNSKAVLGKEGKVLEGFVGVETVKGVTIKGIATYHDETSGSKRGKNSIYTFDLDGVKFCHLGDLGHPLSSALVEEIGSVDVLFIPVGGYFTIGPDTAAKVCDQLKPKIIFPMHYRMPQLTSTFDLLKTVDDFVSSKRNVERTGKFFFDVEQGRLPEQTKIIVLSLTR